jgi:hypothetical protein
MPKIMENKGGEPSPGVNRVLNDLLREGQKHDKFQRKNKDATL